MSLAAGAARRTINPALGTGKAGTRLFGDPIQAIESDLTATALVLAAGETTVVLLALDVCVMSPAEAGRLRAAVGDALGIPAAHVLVNLSHDHSTPGLPEFMASSDSPEEHALKVRYERDLARATTEAAVEAASRLQPARLGCAWGESRIGVYRREQRDGRDVLGEVPEHAIDPSVGVVRVDDLDGEPIATLFRYSAHPVTVGPRSLVASSDYPGPAREVLEAGIGGLALFVQGCAGNVNPRVGIGYEIDCRDTKGRIGLELGGEALKVAARIRTSTRRGERRPLGNVPNILFTPWERVDDVRESSIAAAERTLQLEYGPLPTLDEARAIEGRCRDALAARADADEGDWQLRVAKKQLHWAGRLVAAVEDGHPTLELALHAIRVDDVVFAGLNVEPFFETGLEIRAGSPLPDTFVLGYTNGVASYLPRGEDYPEGGWRLDAAYAVPDLIPQAWAMPVALAPDSERRAVEAALDLIRQVAAP